VTAERAIRVGCEATSANLRCSYPNCVCTILPTAIKAVLAFLGIPGGQA
jgi:hypothetical protein